MTMVRRSSCISFLPHRVRMDMSYIVLVDSLQNCQAFFNKPCDKPKGYVEKAKWNRYKIILHPRVFIAKNISTTHNLRGQHKLVVPRLNSYHDMKNPLAYI